MSKWGGRRRWAIAAGDAASPVNVAKNASMKLIQERWKAAWWGWLKFQTLSTLDLHE